MRAELRTIVIALTATCSIIGFSAIAAWNQDQSGDFAQDRSDSPIDAGNAHAIVNSIYHIVLIDLLDKTGPEEIDALIADGEASIAAIPGVLVVDIGFKAREDRPVHIRDYDLAVYVQLASLEALDVFGPHPKHQEFLARHRHKWSGVRVIDFFGSADRTCGDFSTHGHCPL